MAKRHLYGKERGARWNSAYAWWLLSDTAKARLEEMRRSGVASVGGMGDKAPYAWAQEGSKPEYAKSAAAAGMDRTSEAPSKYIQSALDTVTSKLPSIIRDVLG